MKRPGLVHVVVSLLFVSSVCATAADRSADELIRELKGEASTSERSPEQWLAVHKQVLDAMAPRVGSKDAKESEKAQREYQEICWRAGRPGAEVERAAACRAIVAKLNGALPQPTRLALIKQLHQIGRDESLDCLARLLKHDDAFIRERARRALANNPSPEALAKLREALAQAKALSWRVAIVNALGARRDRASVTTLTGLLDDPEPTLAMAAAAALGQIGGQQAIEALAKAKDTGDARLRRLVADAYLKCADRLLREGKKEPAAAMYEKMHALSGPSHIRIAALQGLLAAREGSAVPTIVAVLKGDDPEMQAAATRFIRELPSAATTRALAGKLPTFAPAGQAFLLDALADRGDPLARGAATAATKSEDEGVRTAALRALAKLGDASTVPLLTRAAAAEEGKPCDAARESLRRLHGVGVDEAIMSGVHKGDTTVRVESIRALVDRRTVAAVPMLTEAAEDQDEKVRLESFRALGVLAGKEDLPALVGLVVRAPRSRERDAATKATIATCRRAQDEDERTAPIVAALGKASVPARSSLLRALGKLGSAKALAAVRAALKARDPTVLDAALRALADWPDDRAGQDLLRVARETKNAVHQVLALRGYVRVVGLSSDRPAEATLKMYANAMSAARRPDEKKLVLAGVGQMKDLAALELATAYLGDSALTAEAATAMLQVAEAISYPHREAAEAAVQQVMAACEDAHVRKRAEQAQARIVRYDECLTNWLVAGPYTKPRKKKQSLFDFPFDPEGPDASKVNWQPIIGAPDPRKSWKVDFDRVMEGSNRAAYMLTWFRSDRAQPATLEMGSDDGIKAWLNGQLVCTHNVSRPIELGDEKVKVELKAGWNRLVLKIVQGGGHWAGCARVRASDASSLAGLTRLDDFRELDTLLADLARPALRAEATSAALEIGKSMVSSHPQAAKVALKAILAAVVDEAVKEQTELLLESIVKYEDYITTWQVCGPYTRAGTAGHDLHQVPLGPEALDPKDVKWRTVPLNSMAGKPWMVDLAKVVGGQDRAAYLRAFVHSPTDQPVTLELGTDDGVVVWLNAARVHANNTPRPVRPGDDRPRTKLAKGWNEMVLKIAQGSGGWGACARFRTPDGSQLNGLRSQAIPPEDYRPAKLQAMTAGRGASQTGKKTK